MKIKLIKALIAILSVSFALTSCSKNEDALATINSTKSTIGYVVTNGYIEFNNVQEYDRVIKSMVKMTKEELIFFRVSLGYKSLYDIYNEVGSPIDSLNTRVEDSYLSMLLNKDGVLIVGDTILKICKEKAYLIPQRNFESLLKIDNQESLSDNSEIKIIEHTRRFTKEIYNDNNGMQKLRGSSSTYDGYIENNLIKPGSCCTPREERVQLRGFCVISPFYPFGLTYIGAAMNGEARHKDVCFFGCSWGGWFTDEINYGKITINSGKYGPSGNCIYDVTTGSLTFNTPNTEFKMGLEYGPTNDLYAKDLNVTYVYQKKEGRNIITTNVIWQ